MVRDVPFKCPKCGHDLYEEIQVDVTVSTGCKVEQHDDGLEFLYSRITNSDGHVDRYQCCGCGFTILDHDSPYCEDGMDVRALVEALTELAKPKPVAKGDLVSCVDLVHRIADAYEALSGEELTNLWNELFPTTPVVYEGDSLFWVKND